MSELIQYLYFLLLISLSIISLGFTHVVVCIRTAYLLSFLFKTFDSFAIFYLFIDQLPPVLALIGDQT